MTLASILNMFRPGHRIYLAGSAGEPTALIDALVLDPERSSGIDIVTSAVPGINRFDFDKLHPTARITTLFKPPPRPNANSAPRLRHLPTTYAGFVRILAADTRGFDLVVVQVAPPDPDGWCSLGLAVEFMPSVLPKARQVIALLNHSMPNFAGAPRLHMSRFAKMVDVDTPLATYLDGPADQVATRISEHIAPFIDDGAVIQAGIGKVPSALVYCLRDRRRLGIHTGMLGGGVRALTESGALDPRARHRACVAVGSRDFYDWIADRTEFALESCETTHDARVLAGLQRFIAVNSAVEVDLYGQCALEYAGGVAVSGAGGAPDFARAARLCRDGLSIVALPATANQGRRSRIVGRLSAPGVATLARTDIDVLVTENGVADLRCLTVEERVEAIIQIAAPEFRRDLQSEWTEK